MSVEIKRIESFARPVSIKFDKNESTTIQTKYQENELEMYTTIVKAMIKTIYIGIIIIFVGIVMCLFGKTDIAVLVGVSGIFIDIISGIVILVLQKISTSKYDYYIKLSLDSERKELIEVVKQEPNKSFREKMITKLVEAHCKKCVK